MTRPFAILGLTLLLVSACAPRYVAHFDDRAAQGASYQNVFVVSQNPLSPDFVPVAGAPRTAEMNLEHVTISIPPNHQAGQIEWAPSAKTADPKQHFVVHKKRHFDSLPRWVDQMVKTKPADNRITIFTHGYNSTPSEAIYRTAQMQQDFGSHDQNQGILYNWASSGQISGYVYDRDSVLFARDNFVKLIKTIARQTSLDIDLAAHSMGSLLVVEAMRQLALEGERAVLQRINSVALIEPDLDPDLFRRQLSVIDPLPEAFVIIVTKHDNALKLSAWLTGTENRLGTITDPAAIMDLPVSVIDLSNFSQATGLNHGVAFSNPEAISHLKNIDDPEQVMMQRYVILGESF